MEEDGERNGLARMPGITRSRDSGEQALREPHSRERLRWSLGSAPRGLCPPPRRAGRGRTDTQAPHGRGSARVQGQTDVLLPDFPARRGFTGFTLRFQAGRAHRPAQAGARLPDRRPGVRTPGRDTPPPGAMRNLRVPEDAHSGDW